MNEESASFAVESVSALARQRAAHEVWRDGEGSLIWLQFGTAVEAVRRQCVAAGVGPGAVVITPGEATIEALAWLFGAAAVGAVVAPLRAERFEEIHAWKEFLIIGWHVWAGRLVWIGEGKHSPATQKLLGELWLRNQPGLILATGGTTGASKLVLHDLNALLATIPVRNAAPRRTLPLMRFDHIGGLDMAWRALAGRQVLVGPPTELTPEAVAATIARHGVEVMPATPSFLNLMLLAGVHTSHDLASLRLVPYGAEPMPAGLLARLRLAFPQVEFIERFGTSETGALPVRSTKAGLQLRHDRASYAWKVVGDELWVRSPAQALGYLSSAPGTFDADGWFRTGDLVAQASDGSIRVLGRREEQINVGGEKVLPAEVEAVLLTHPLVSDCRVGAEPNGVLGQVVAAEIVWLGPEVDAVEVKRALHTFAADLLARHKLPAVVRLVGELATTPNLKKLRMIPT